MKPQNDPYNMFGREFQLGTAIYFVEFLVYNFPSEEDDEVQAISNVIAPHGEVGKLRTIWTPLPIGDAEEPEEISDPEELLGKAWKAKVGAWPCMNPPAVSCTRWRLQCHVLHTSSTHRATHSGRPPHRTAMLCRFPIKLPS